MKYRTLGTYDGGLTVSAIGIGCMPMIRDGNINYGAADDRYGVSKAQVALAWLLAQGEDVVPIPGVKRRATMADSAGAPDLTLTAADLAALDAAAPRGGTAGLRYGERGMKLVRR